METIRFRPVTPADAPVLLRIYAPYVEHTVISFEAEVPTQKEFARRVVEISARWPYLICEVDGETVGYSYASPLRERAAYQWDVELSGYFRQGATGRGLGAAALAALLEVLRLQNICNAYGCVVVPNPSSEAVLQRFGFIPAGVWTKTGWKHGRWLDVAWFQKRLIAGDAPPAPLKGIAEVDPAAVAAILKRHGVVK